MKKHLFFFFFHSSKRKWIRCFVVFAFYEFKKAVEIIFVGTLSVTTYTRAHTHTKCAVHSRCVFALRFRVSRTITVLGNRFKSASFLFHSVLADNLFLSRISARKRTENVGAAEEWRVRRAHVRNLTHSDECSPVPSELPNRKIWLSASRAAGRRLSKIHQSWFAYDRVRYGPARVGGMRSSFCHRNVGISCGFFSRVDVSIRYARMRRYEKTRFWMRK